MSSLTYYQRNRDVKLNRAKAYLKMIKKDKENKQEINIETSLKKTKTKRENMEKTDTIICLKKRNKDKRNIKKIIARLKKSQYNNE